MINAKLVTCGLCQHYYSDPRQIPCGHSFCFDCISGQLDEETWVLTCPKCQKEHQYESIEEFQNRCMRDGFLSNMVAQFRKSQSRSSAKASRLLSRPSSSASHLSPSFSSTPIPTSTPFFSSQPANEPNADQSGSERSTPSIFNQPQSPSVLQQSTSRPLLFAKCQACNIRGDLIVCSHCDNVICVKCADEHQSVVNDDVKREWQSCQTNFERINDQSMRFEGDQDDMKSQARSLQTWIGKQSEKLIQALDHQKTTYIDSIEQHRRRYKESFVQRSMIEEYESIDKRITDLLRSNDINADKVQDFLSEIEHLENQLDELNKTLVHKDLKFPVLTFPEHIDTSSLLGSLEFVPKHCDLNPVDPYTVPPTLTPNHQDLSSSRSDTEDEFVRIDSLMSQASKEPPASKYEPTQSSAVSVPPVSKKKLLWQIDYFSVPYYVRTHGNQLFICDKYGSLAIYKFNNKTGDMRQKPNFVREIKLFKEHSSSSASDDDQTIIDSFVVYKLWLVVFKRKKNELHGTIFLFTHEGKPVPNGRYVHNYPSRELTIDTDTNVLWSLDQKQLCLFYYALPDTRSTNLDDCFQNRHSHVHFSKPFAPIHISVNKHVLAVLDKNRQAVHVYDKKNQHQLYEHVNMHCNTTHFCWDMALFSDDSLLIKLDETSTLKAGPSKHVYLQLDTTNQHNIIGMIEETDAYGMMITPSDEILIGVRISTKGIVKCYV